MRKVAVMGLGRLNPPTKGHLKLVNKISEVADDNDTIGKLYLTHTQDPFKNPLSYERKVHWCKEAFSDLVDVVESDAKTIIEALTELNNNGYTDLIYVGGGDRIGGEEDVSGLIMKYNGVPDRRGNIPYKFNSIKFENAGERDDGSEDLATRASASAARGFVTNRDFDSFENIVPFNISSARELYDELSICMGAVDEAYFSAADVGKANDNYFNKVIDYILANHKIIIGESKTNGLTEIDIESSVGDWTQFSADLEDLRVQGTSGTSSDISAFDKLMGEYNLPVSWRKIFKGTFSGRVAGQSDGEYSEALVCYIYNHIDDSGVDASVDEICENNRINNDWKKSSYAEANAIDKKWNHYEYVAVHVDGHDIGNLPNEVKLIAEIYKSKDSAAKVLGKNSGYFKDLYFGGKDNWNKADILLVKPGYNIIDNLSTVESSDELNQELTKLVVSGIIIPLSLKMADVKHPENLRLNGHNLGEVESDVSFVKVALPKVLKNSLDASCYLVGDDKYKIQFRTMTGTNGAAPSIEASVIGDKARYGKGITKVKYALGLRGNDWVYGDFDSEAEFYKRLTNLGFESDSIDDTTDNNKLEYGEDSEFPWYNRTACRALVYIMEAYKQKFGGTKEDFFNYCWSTMTGGTGSFYVLH